MAEAEPAFVAAQARAALIGGDTARAREFLEGLPEFGDSEAAVRRARILLAKGTRPAHQFLQVLSVAELHDEEVGAVRGEAAVQGSDVRV